MDPGFCIWNEGAFKKQAHKSSKGDSECLEWVQACTADALLPWGEEEVTALIRLPLLRTSVLLNGWHWLCTFTIYEGLSQGTK